MRGVRFVVYCLLQSLKYGRIVLCTDDYNVECVLRRMLTGQCYTLRSHCRQTVSS